MTQRVIITGASGGIGQAVAWSLCGTNCELVLATRNPAKLEQIKWELEQHQALATVVECDVTQTAGATQLLGVARDLGKGVEPVLVNCVGAAEFGDFAEMPLASIDSLFAANLLGPTYVCHEFIPWMLEEGRGQIINVLSIAATTTFPGAAVYCSAKAGLHALTKALAAECRAKEIRVTSLIPGSTDTPLWEAQSWSPPKEDMLPARAVAEAIRDLIFMPRDRSVDELVLMPPKGIL